MPVRFQVDPDFYDHPKTVGMSDAAVALWTRAGSYSAAKLTDGFIAEHVLALLSQTPQEAADELKRRGLWSRVKGGYLFHEWGERNLTKQRVQDDQKADRDRKRAKRKAEQEAVRKAAGQNGKPQIDLRSVRAESDPTPDGIQVESDESPGVSVSVSVSGSVSGSGRGAEAGNPPPGGPPPPTCDRHIDDPDPPPCGPCATRRRAREAWDEQHERQHRIADQAARSQRARNQAEASRIAIERCTRCDHRGQLANGRACTHQAEASPASAAAAREAARAAMRRPDPVQVARQRGSALDGLTEATAGLPPLSEPPGDPPDDPLAEVVPIRPAALADTQPTTERS